MVSRIWTVPLAILAFLPAAAANAQNLGPDEAVGPDGSVRQELALTAAQRNAIYNAVVQRGASPSHGTQIPVAVGAPVARSVELSDLPNPTATSDVWIKSSTNDLKYAMVEDNVVVVDPVSMRVVDVIRGGAKP